MNICCEGSRSKRVNIPHTQSMSWLLETKIRLSVRREERGKLFKTTFLENLHKKQFEFKGNVIFSK